MNLLESPNEFSIKNIPIDKRKIIINKMLEANNKAFDIIVSILADKSNYTNLKKEFHRRVGIVDGIRNQTFSNFYPEIFDIMNTN